MANDPTRLSWDGPNLHPMQLLCYTPRVNFNSIPKAYSSVPNDQFRRLSLAYQSFAAEAGISLVAFRDSQLPWFTGLSAEHQHEILIDLQHCVNICESTKAQGNKMDDSPALLWAALREFKLRPPSDLFAHITGNSVVEVHSPAGIQLFRNFNFYRYCSYSIEELYCRAWHELYERDEVITAQLIEFATKLYTNQIHNTVAMGVPSHTVREVFSPLRYEVRLQMLWLAPLYQDQGSPAASLVIESANFIRSTANPQGDTANRPTIDRNAAIDQR